MFDEYVFFSRLQRFKPVAFLTMEDTEPTAGQNTRGKDGNQEVDRSLVLMGTKPLHRFIRGEPRCLGVRTYTMHCHKQTKNGRACGEMV